MNNKNSPYNDLDDFEFNLDFLDDTQPISVKTPVPSHEKSTPNISRNTPDGLSMPASMSASVSASMPASVPVPAKSSLIKTKKRKYSKITATKRPPKTTINKIDQIINFIQMNDRLPCYEDVSPEGFNYRNWLKDFRVKFDIQSKDIKERVASNPMLYKYVTTSNVREHLKEGEQSKMIEHLSTFINNNNRLPSRTETPYLYYWLWRRKKEYLNNPEKYRQQYEKLSAIPMVKKYIDNK